MELTKNFVNTITTIWGHRGIAWLEELPELVGFFSARWHISYILPFDNLSYHYVVRGFSTSYQKNIVLKIGIPSAELIQEIRALEFYEGNGCVKLLDYDEEKGGMLLELIEPGITLRSFFPKKDDQAVAVACQVMKKLHSKRVPDLSQFTPIEKWFSLFETLQVPQELQHHVAQARVLVEQLKNSEPHVHLLHGDLHHDNILLNASSEGIAIDPKGVIGEAAYEVGAFMCNPGELSKQKNISSILNRRLDQFSQILSIDRQRIAQACYVRIILSACWTVQDRGDWRGDVRFAEGVLDLFKG